MALEIKQKHPISFGIKIALAVIIAAVILGGFLRITGNNSSVTNEPDDNKPIILGMAGNVFVPVIKLPVKMGSYEREWNTALANRINGQSEVQIDQGRVDVMTDAYAIEIDFMKKWHEGLGQAIHYGDASNRIGVLALIQEKNHEKYIKQLKLLRTIEHLCIEKGVKLILLRSSNESS